MVFDELVRVEVARDLPGSVLAAAAVAAQALVMVMVMVVWAFGSVQIPPVWSVQSRLRAQVLRVDDLRPYELR